MPTPPTVRVAVLIDADNTSPSYAAALLAEVAKYGVPTVKRAYGDWTNPHLSGWKERLNRHAIQPVQQFAYTTGKNSTDFALVIDAMDLLYSGNVDAFAIVSSDSDFTRLATRLRESGRTVYGFGQRKSPQALQQAVDRFVFLEVLSGRDDEETGGRSPRRPRDDRPSDEPEGDPLPDLRTILTSAVDDTSGDDGWAHLGAVGSVLSTRYPSFDSRNYGFGRLIALARAQDHLEVEQRDGDPMVRLAPEPEQPRRSAATKAAATKAATKTGAAKKGTAKKGAAKKAATRTSAAKQVAAEEAVPEETAAERPTVTVTTRSARSSTRAAAKG